jgi:hypothetical protein
MRTFWKLVVLASLACAVPTSVSAQSLGINWIGSDAGNVNAEPSSLDPTDLAGVVTQGNWNNLDLATGSATSGIVYDNGMGTAVPSTVTVDWASPNSWRSAGNNTFPTGGNRKLMSGYLDSNNTAAGGVMITVSNIDQALRGPSYDVYVYFLGDNAEQRGGGYTIDDGTGPVLKYGSSLGTPTMHIEDPGTDQDMSLDGTYLKFSGLTGSSFTLTTNTELTMPNGFRAPVNGIQIVRTVVPGDVNNDGQVNLTDFHIIRGNLFKTGQTRAQGDLVGGDGIVDFADFREWKVRAPAGMAAGVSLSGNIPEPTSGILLAVGGALAAIGVRRSGRASSARVS